MDLEKLNKALDNEENEYLINLTTKKINGMKREIIQELEVSKEVEKEFLKKLKDYRYIDEMNELKIGSFVRWIPITDPDDIHLTKGGIVCDLKITNTGMSIVVKNFSGKHYQTKMDECLLFQKMTGQELVLLAALDHLSKE
jgi:hypothetical protein